MKLTSTDQILVQVLFAVEQDVEAMTSVGNDSIYHLVRSICFQNTPIEFPPGELPEENALNIYYVVFNND